MPSTLQSPPSPTAPAGGGYAELTRQVRSAGLMAPRRGFYAVLGCANLIALGAIVAGMIVLRDSWWLILLAPVLAVVSTQIAFFSHDAAHLQISRKSKIVTALCLVHGNLLNGLSHGWWVSKHNAHHARPNDLETDPDVAVGVFVWDADQAAARSGFAGWMTRHQAGLFFPILLLEGLNLQISSLRAVLVPGMRRRGLEAGLLLAHAALYVALLVTTMTWLQALVFLAVHQGLFGLYLGSSFAPSHKGIAPLTEEQTADPLLRQVLASRNVRGGPLRDFAQGGLNLQIEHHLFPSMPRPALRQARPLVQAHCAERGIPYAEVSLLESYGLGLRHMHGVGDALR